METVQFVCEYCGSIHKNKSALNFHKKSTKKCLLIQAQMMPSGSVKSSLATCSKCNREFAKHNLQLHLLSCKGGNETILNIQSQLDEKDKEIAALKQALATEKAASLKREAKIHKLRNALVRRKNMHKELATINHEQKRIIVDLRKRAPSKLTKIGQFLKSSPHFIDFTDVERTRKLLETSTHEDWSTLAKLGQFVAENLLIKDNIPLYISTDPTRANFCYKNAREELCADLNAGVLRRHILKCQLLPIIRRIMSEHNALNPGCFKWHIITIKAHETYLELLNYGKCSAFFQTIADITTATLSEAL